MAKKRNFKKEYRTYHGTPAQIKRRSMRNKARRKQMKQGRVHKFDGKDVDHRLGVGRGNSAKNLRVLSKHANRSYNRDSKHRQVRRVNGAKI
jgi:hypothetical protein